jgi:hypothetical protein
VLTLVAQQPALDLTLPIRDLTQLRLVRQAAWSYVVVPLALTAFFWWRSHEGSAASSFEWAGKDFIYWLVPVTFLLVAAVMRRNFLVVSTQDARAEMDISLFSRPQARRFVEAVRTVRTDLPR